MRHIPALLIVCALSAGGGPQAALADPFKLDSGKVVEIIAVAAVNTNWGAALKLNYRSKTALSDTATLRCTSSARSTRYT